MENPNEQQTEQKEQKLEKIDDNVLLVGKKPLYSYENAVKMILTKSDNVIIKTRGKFITKAVNVAEIAKRQNDLETDKITIGSDKFTNEEGKELTVSTIEIVLKKKQ